jgi:hypothetical protein
MMENFIVLVYVLIVINNSDNPSIMKHVCDLTAVSEDNSNTKLLTKKCATEILNDVFFYSLFFKLIVAIVSILAMFFMNRTTSSSLIGNASAETGVVNTTLNTTVA